MAAHPQTPSLSIEEFDRLYGTEKPRYEYWDGQAIQKSTPTLLHSLLQVILINLLREAGLISCGEVRLKLTQSRQPLPDVIGGDRLQHPYPNKPFAVAIEILSPDDRMQYMVRRCRFLSEQGLGNVYLFDPGDRTAQRWNNENGTFENVSWLDCGNLRKVPVERIWGELDRELEKVDFVDDGSRA